MLTILKIIYFDNFIHFKWLMLLWRYFHIGMFGKDHVTLEQPAVCAAFIYLIVFITFDRGRCQSHLSWSRCLWAGLRCSVETHSELHQLRIWGLQNLEWTMVVSIALCVHHVEWTHIFQKTDQWNPSLVKFMLRGGHWNESGVMASQSGIVFWWRPRSVHTRNKVAMHPKVSAHKTSSA